jgi:hypothetical protein
LIFEAMRFGGVLWLVTMSPSVVAKVIRRRRRILRATHKLMTEQAANVKPGEQKRNRALLSKCGGFDLGGNSQVVAP